MGLTGVLFAAGRGTRLRPLTEQTPKAALPLLDTPLGAWGLRALAAAGLRVVANACPGPGTLAAALAPYGNLEVVVEGPEPLGTAATLRALRDRLGSTVVTCNADVVLEQDAAARLLEAHRRAGLPATVAVMPAERDADFEVSGRRVVRLLDRRAGSGRGWRFAGLAAFERPALERIPGRVPLGLAAGLLAPLIGAGELTAHPLVGYLRDAGTPASYLQANLDLLDGRAPPAAPPPGRIEEAGGGRAYIGPGARVAPGSLGHGAVVLAGAAVHPGARVESSVVWSGPPVPAGARLRDSVWALGREVFGLAGEGD